MQTMLLSLLLLQLTTRCLSGLQVNGVITGPACVLAEDESPKPGCRWTNIKPISQQSHCGRSSWVHVSRLSSVKAGRCHPDILRRIGIAFTVVHSMDRVWRQTRLQLQMKLRLYQTCIMFILLYGSEACTPLQEDLQKPAYDSWGALARLCQKHWDPRCYQPSLYAGRHQQEAKLTIWPRHESCQSHTSSPDIIASHGCMNWFFP